MCQRQPGSRNCCEANCAEQRGHVPVGLKKRGSSTDVMCACAKQDPAPGAVLSACVARELMHHKKEIWLTWVPVINNAQIEHDRNASAQPYAVLHSLVIVAQNPEQPHEVSFEITKTRFARGQCRSSNIRVLWFDLPKIDTGQKGVGCAQSFLKKTMSP